jgi:hypothetical protein
MKKSFDFPIKDSYAILNFEINLFLCFITVIWWIYWILYTTSSWGKYAEATDFKIYISLVILESLKKCKKLKVYCIYKDLWQYLSSKWQCFILRFFCCPLVIYHKTMFEIKDKKHERFSEEGKCIMEECEFLCLKDI